MGLCLISTFFLNNEIVPNLGASISRNMILELPSFRSPWKSRGGTTIQASNSSGSPTIPGKRLRKAGRGLPVSILKEVKNGLAGVNKYFYVLQTWMGRLWKLPNI